MGCSSATYGRGKAGASGFSGSAGQPGGDEGWNGDPQKRGLCKDEAAGEAERAEHK